MEGMTQMDNSCGDEVGNNEARGCDALRSRGKVCDHDDNWWD